MTWPYPNLEVLDVSSGTYAGPDNVYRFVLEFEPQPVGRNLLAVFNIRAATEDVTPGWTSLFADEFPAPETNSNVFHRVSTGVEDTFTAGGAHAEIVDGWSAFLIAFDGEILAGPNLVDGPDDDLVAAAAEDPEATAALWILNAANNITVGPSIDDPELEEHLIVSAAGGADLEALFVFGARRHGGAPSVEWLTNGTLYGVAALGLRLRFGGWKVGSIDIGGSLPLPA